MQLLLSFRVEPTKEYVDKTNIDKIIVPWKHIKITNHEKVEQLMKAFIQNSKDAMKNAIPTLEQEGEIDRAEFCKAFLKSTVTKTKLGLMINFDYNNKRIVQSEQSDGYLCDIATFTHDQIEIELKCNRDEFIMLNF
jgi:hypothetical protein